MSDVYNLERFIDAQEDEFESALDELRRGSKRSHWMWFIFPQIAGLGVSPTSQHFAISSLGEAVAYLAHPVLGDRLRQCLGALLHWAGKRSAEQILGPVDAMKLRSCLTLFDQVAPEDVFDRALTAFFDGCADERTLALLERTR